MFVSASVSVVTGITPVGAQASGSHHSGSAIAVSLGDSFISGEAGRWAGNSSGATTLADALGPTAYFDNATHTAEQIPGCHRAAKSLIHFTTTLTTVNLACSGATTATAWSSKGNFKPGLDFYDDGHGHIGQAAALRDYAKGKKVTLVVVSIGGNDFHFSNVIETCLSDYLLSLSWSRSNCHTSPEVLKYLSPAFVTGVQADITNALHNVRQAMREAGHHDGTYNIVVLNYPSVIATSKLFRYGESGADRFSVGGCGFWNADADWADTKFLGTLNDTVSKAVHASGISKIHVLDNSNAFVGRRLCERTVNLIGANPEIASWKSHSAVDRTEWVSQIRTVTTVFGPYFVQESLHPNYWGERALSACLDLAWNHGNVRGGSCTIQHKGLHNGAPIMELQ